MIPKRSSWQTVTIETPSELKDAIVGEFFADGLAGAWERSILLKGQIELVLYFEEGLSPSAARRRIDHLFEGLGHRPPERVLFGFQQDEDWMLEWRKRHRSFLVGRRFRIVPSWEEPRPVGDRLTIRMNPGMAFGTGLHETTQLMLEALETIPIGSGRLLDLGTGTGILAIAAAKLGVARVNACDIDPDAVSIAQKNIRENGTSVDLVVGSLDVMRSSSFAVLLANLTRETIDDLLSEIRRVLKPEGRAVLSGILDTEISALREGIQAYGYAVERETAKREWVALVLASHGR